MDITFISIHSLDEDCRVLYSSDSVLDILGYTPEEIANRPVWDFFPEEELPFARDFHKKRVSMDNAAVLAYCRVRHRDGYWVGCECCFTIVYDVMVVCTSVYQFNGASEKRAQEAPIVRRLFSSSPRDPRYHMLSHISKKFAAPSIEQDHEPRAALFLNRFTRSLSIMYCTSGISEIIGIPAEKLRGRSFYYCIAENCLPDAVRCLETAKGNHSIAYLRFWFRDPRQDDPSMPWEESEDEEMTMTESSATNASESSAVRSSSIDVDAAMEDVQPDSRASSDESGNKNETHEAIFGSALPAESSTSSAEQSPEQNNTNPMGPEPIELEAVISCASDGLVVCLRRARPMLPHPTHRPSQPTFSKGLYAAPWAQNPIVPSIEERSGTVASSHTPAAFAPALGPHGARPAAPASASSLPVSDYMRAIREQAVFAWALTGINGSLADFSRGKPIGDAVPGRGLPVWEADARQGFAGRQDSHAQS